jgi:hypothetical protein
VIASNVISKVLKNNNIHSYNYFIIKKNNVIIITYMNKIAGFKKENYISFGNVKNLNNRLRNNIEMIREEILISLTNKIERKFV